MATVTGKTSPKIDELLGETVVSGSVDSSGQLVLSKKNGSTVSIGSIGSSIVSATINSAKRLIFTSREGTQIDAGSIVTVKALDAWPIGSVYIGITSANPNTLLGGGTWEAFAKGKMLVGVDPADPSFDAVQETGGSKSKTLVEANLPPHAHAIDHNHDPFNISFQYAQNVGGSSGAGSRVTDIQNQTGGAGSSDNFSVNVPPIVAQSGNGAGTSQAFDIMNPYITTYMWKRTA